MTDYAKLRKIAYRDFVPRIEAEKPNASGCKKKDDTDKEFRFTAGPVYIGRHTHSQIFLHDRAVSRQHAVIFSTQDGTWMVEDLDSANKTYLNGKVIHKVEINTGDTLRIAGFSIEIDLEEKAGPQTEQPVHLEDTIVTAAHEPQVVLRRLDAEHAPDIILPAKRARDFAQATEAICEANGLDEVVAALLRLVSKQFRAFHIWCALRSEPSGPMTAQAGKRRDGQSVRFEDIKLSDKITESIEKGQFLLLPRVPTQLAAEKVRSVMIAPVMGPAGCFGVIYLDNAMDHEHYSLGDLDYLMFLAIHTASVLKNF